MLECVVVVVSCMERKLEISVRILFVFYLPKNCETQNVVEGVFMKRWAILQEVLIRICY